MHQIMVFIKSSDIQFLFSYETEAAAKTALQNINERLGEKITVKDEFSHVAHFSENMIAAAMYSDINQEMQANYIKDICQKRKNRDIAAIVNNDPELKVLYGRTSIAAPPAGFSPGNA